MSREYPPRPIVGVGVVVWKDDRVLLVRRGKPPRQGQWSLPGGAQRLGETLGETARREVQEETGLEVRLTGLVDALDSIERDGDGGVRYHYTLVDFAAEWQEGTARAGGDAAEVGWFGLAELARLGLWSETLRVIEHAAARRHGERPLTLTP
jgi:ADP-ribose pyrophosphatase YjhB (NUDIX family)